MPSPLSLQRALGSVAAVAAVAAAAYHADPERAGRLGLDFWNLPRLYAGWQTDLDRMSELEDQDRRVMVQIELKQTVAEHVAAGECSLAEAVERFRKINSTDPNYARRLMLVSRPACKSLDEALGRQVIRLVQQALEDNPSKLHERVRQLEAELDQLLARTARL